jgi:hypothetical protein
VITNLQIGRSGRLGNQLFQYAILKVLSVKNGYDIVLPPDVFTRVWHGQKCALDSFKLPSCIFTNPSVQYQYVESDPRGYDLDITKVPDNTTFSGFFQHPGYYNEMQECLRVEFELQDNLQVDTQKILSQYKNTTVSLHIRRGDLTDGSTGNSNDIGWSNDFSKGSVMESYYKKALSMVPLNSTIFLFTGGSKNNGSNSSDLDWCKNHFKDGRIIYVDNLADIETFALMSSCDYNITSFASTFSWWASFLNKSNNVIAPRMYYPSYPSLTPDMVYPKNWTLI